jgi:hypothetical protein
MNKIELISQHTDYTITKNYTVSVGDNIFTYKEFLNEKGKVIDEQIFDVNGDEVIDDDLLEEVRKFIDNLEK